jgi:hypothetical protein
MQSGDGSKANNASSETSTRTTTPSSVRIGSPQPKRIEERHGGSAVAIKDMLLFHDDEMVAMFCDAGLLAYRERVTFESAQR